MLTASARASWVCFSLAALACACIGSVSPADAPGAAEDGTEGPGRPAATTPASTAAGSASLPAATCAAAAGPAPLRRLTRREYANTVRDLLGSADNPARSFASDGYAGPFESNVELPVSVGIVNDYASAAETLAAAADLDRLVPCRPASSSAEPNCARQFLTAFLERAFRRPVREGDVARYSKIYSSARERGHPFADAIRLVIAAVLQSPHFLNHIELGDPKAPIAGQGLRLASHEVAARLSYFLWRSLPDPALLEAAATGRLTTPADLEREAQRLLAAPRGRETALGFYRQWLHLSALDDLSRDPKVFPAFRPGIGPALAAETEAFVNSVLWDGDGRLATLLTARHSFVNQAVASVYRITGVTGDALRRVELDPAERGGLLTQPALLAQHAHFAQTSPVHRGKFVRGGLLCQTTPPPPAEVNVSVPPPDPKQTTRQRYLSMLQDAACSACHRLMNPIGLALEKYDGMGQFRTTEHGLAIDASGEIVGTRDSDGTFDGAIQLGERLARSAEVRGCLARTWFTYAVGRSLSPEESCALEPLVADFEGSGGDLRKLIIAVAKSDAFRARALPSMEACQ